MCEYDYLIVGAGLYARDPCGVEKMKFNSSVLNFFNSNSNSLTCDFVKLSLKTSLCLNNYM